MNESIRANCKMCGDLEFVSDMSKTGIDEYVCKLCRTIVELKVCVATGISKTCFSIEQVKDILKLLEGYRYVRSRF